MYNQDSLFNTPNMGMQRNQGGMDGISPDILAALMQIGGAGRFGGVNQTFPPMVPSPPPQGPDYSMMPPPQAITPEQGGMMPGDDLMSSLMGIGDNLGDFRQAQAGQQPPMIDAPGGGQMHDPQVDAMGRTPAHPSRQLEQTLGQDMSGMGMGRTAPKVSEGAGKGDTFDSIRKALMLAFMSQQGGGGGLLGGGGF